MYVFIACTRALHAFSLLHAAYDGLEILCTSYHTTYPGWRRYIKWVSKKHASRATIVNEIIEGLCESDCHDIKLFVSLAKESVRILNFTR